MPNATKHDTRLCKRYHVAAETTQPKLTAALVLHRRQQAQQLLCCSTMGIAMLL
jgi:hypothetical protein